MGSKGNVSKVPEIVSGTVLDAELGTGKNWLRSLRGCHLTKSPFRREERQ